MRWHGRTSVIIGAVVTLVLVTTALPVGAAPEPGGYIVRTRDIFVAEGTPGFGGGYVRCGRGQRVVTGGAFWHREGEGADPSVNAYVSSSAPMPDGKRWFGAGINWGGDAYLRVIAYCLPASKVGTYTVRTFDTTVASKAVASDDRRCPVNQRIVSGGAFWHQAGLGPDDSVEGYLRSSTPDGDARGWFVAAYNDQEELGLTTVALCLPATSVGRVTLRKFDVPIPQSSFGAGRRACGAGKRALGGGAYWHRPGEPRDATLTGYLRGSFPHAGGRSWFTLGANGAKESLQLRIVVLCRPA